MKISLSSHQFDGTNGLYVGCRVLKNPGIRLPFNLPWVYDTDLHCTIMRSPEEAPDYLEALKSVASTLYTAATIEKLDYWEGAEDGGHLVAILKSPGLEKRFEFWDNLGAESIYPTFIPHVTLARGFEYTPAIETSVKDFNKRLKIQPMQYMVGSEYIENINDDNSPNLV